MLKENEFKKLFPRGTKLPLVDTIRDTLKVIDLNGLANINNKIVKKAIESKTFINGTIDRTKIFGSNKKHCEKCLTTQIRGKKHYYHSGAVMSLVGNAPKLVLGYEMYNPKVDSSSKNEGELNVSKRLLTRVIEMHKNLVDIVTYDALACNSKFLNHCIELGVDAIIRVKQNNNNSIKKVKKIVNKKE